MYHSAIIQILEQTSIWPAPLCDKYSEYGNELHKNIWNHEIIEVQESWNNIRIHEVYFKSYSKTHSCVAAILYSLSMCQR